MKIIAKVNLILILVFFSGILISGVALSKVLERKAQNEVTGKALVLMEMANSVRFYTDQRINPILTPMLETEEKFLPEAIPTYSVREVFEILRKNKDFNDYFYKDATLNPTNLRDIADEFETDIVKQFRQNSSKKTLSGFREIGGEKLFYSARPFIIEEQRCLRCHTTPELAPKSQVVAYGRDNGYGWKLNEVIAAQVVYVPSKEIFTNAIRSSGWVILILLGIFSLIFGLINYLLKKTILQRVKKIATVAEQVSIGDMDATFGKQPNDEIGALAEAFNRMKYSLEIAFNLLNQNKK